METFSKYLRHKFWEWQKEVEKPMRWNQFAEYLGVSPQTMSSWVNGGVLPGAEHALRLADKLGYEVYDILGIEPPISRQLLEIDGKLDELPPEDRALLIGELVSFVEGWLAANGFVRVK